MKSFLFNLLTISYLIFGFQNSNAQCGLTLSDLTKTSMLTSDSFETYVLNRGYSLSPTQGDGTFDYKQYLCDSKRNSGYSDMTSRIKPGEGNPQISYNTTNKQIYLKFKSDLKTNGYKFQYKKDNPVGPLTATYYYCTNGKYQVDYYSYYLPQGEVTWYIMDLWKL